MTAQKLDGKAASAAIKDELRARVAALAEKGVVPGIATVLVGADPASQLYVGMKHRASEAIGMNSIQRELPADATQTDVEALIDELNADPSCHGYIVQLPLPKHIDTDAVLERIDPAKDADGLHPTNLGRLVLNVNAPITTPLPCTPRGVIELLQRNGYDLNGKHVVVVGRGVTIGRSIGLLLTRREINATVTLTHTGTADLSQHLKQADVIVAAAGVFSQLLTISGIPQDAVAAIQEMNMEPWMVLMVINVLLLFVGCLLDPGSAILVLTPLLAPIAMAIGVDLIHFGIIMTVNLAIGMFTPPFGLNIFVTQALFKVPLTSIYPGLVPFILVNLVALLIITYVPELSLYLLQFIG